MRTVILILVLAFLGTAFGGETGAELKAKGIEALRAAQADPDQIVVAARFLSQAADALIAEGKDAEAEEVNSCLFWAKKKMTIAQIDMFLAKGNGVAKAAVAKMEAVVAVAVKPEDAKGWLAKVDGYAESQKDGFLVAVRYFEVASRFKGTPEGDQALEKSLKFLQQAKVAQPANKVVGAAEKGDGKVYVQSNPIGASILVRQNNELRDTGAKTPSLVQLPKGPTTLVLRKDKYEDSEVQVVAGDAITKPDVVKMEFPKYDVEVTVSAEMGEGWSVFVDGKPVMDKTGKPAVAPCTIQLPAGNAVVATAKEGFKDSQPVRIAVKESGNSAEIKGRAGAGQSALIAYMIKNQDWSGTWQVALSYPLSLQVKKVGTGYELRVSDLTQDGKVKKSATTNSFTKDGQTLLFKWEGPNTFGFTIVSGGMRVRMWAGTFEKVPESMVTRIDKVLK